MKIEIPDYELVFSYARSSGPGGQNVNKTSSKVILHWKISEAHWLPNGVRQRFMSRYATKINSDGDVVIQSDETRDRLKNQRECVEKLLDMLRDVWHPPKKRVATKPTHASKKRRVAGKRQRSDLKEGRKRISRGHDHE